MWLTFRELLRHGSWRARFETMRLGFAYLYGSPRQTLEVSGSGGALMDELTAALAEVHSRRAGLPAVHVEEGADGRPMDETPPLLAENGEKADNTTILPSPEDVPAEGGSPLPAREQALGDENGSPVETGGLPDDRGAAGQDANAPGVLVESESDVVDADDPKAAPLPASDVPANGDEPRDDEDEANVGGES